MLQKVFMGIFIIGLGTACLPYLIDYLTLPARPAKIKDKWWGPGKPLPDGAAIPKDDEKLQPLVIKVEDHVLEDLKQRLNSTKLTPALDNVQFQYGFHTDYLKKVIDYWVNKYDWRKQEKELNKYQHFLTQIEGIDVHFIRVKPEKPKKEVVPILLIHGWPGSVWEFYKVIPMLTTLADKNFEFEIICPSLPGYGFSEAPHQPGFSVVDAGRVLVKLMNRLGHNKFYIQGGDWGHLVGQAMSIFYPESVKGFHTNIAIMPGGAVAIMKQLVGSVCPSLVTDSPEEAKLLLSPFKETFFRLLREFGYMHLQATKPDTVGVALRDSPAGLAAYILEKFSSWTDMDFVNLPDGGLTRKYTMDELLTNVMIYWVTNSITSSMRFYKENFSGQVWAYHLDRLPVTVPTAISAFPNEILAAPRSIVKIQFLNIVSFKLVERGGHFAAFEEPSILAEEVVHFVDEVQRKER